MNTPPPDPHADPFFPPPAAPPVIPRVPPPTNDTDPSPGAVLRHPSGQPSFSTAMDDGGRIFRERYGLLVGVCAVAALINIAASIPVGWIPVVGSLLSTLVTGPLLAGVYYLGVRLARGHHSEFNDAFRGFHRYGPVAAITVAKAAIAVVPGLLLWLLTDLIRGTPGGTSPELTALLAIVMIATYTVMYYFYTRWAFAEIIAIDPVFGHPPILECFAKSWQFSLGRFWWLLGTYLLLSLLVAASVLLLGIGIILLGGPFALAVWGSVYAQVVAYETADRCRNCGYPTADLTTTICPECGQSLDTAGFATREAAPPTA